MAQSQIQEQHLEQTQRQITTQQQMMISSLVEMPLTRLIEKVETELNDNPALELVAPGDEAEQWQNDSDDDAADDDFESTKEREDRQSALDEALQGLGSDDEDLPVYQGGNTTHEEQDTFVYGQTVSFYDKLKEQIGEVEISERQRDILEYIIGSLDDDGLLRKPTDTIVDELDIHYNMDTSTEEVESVVSILQEFDPAGIGARSLQECLLLQIKRRDDSRLKNLMKEVIEKHFDEFTKNKWKDIRQQLGLNDGQTEALHKELIRLNPKPGAALGETIGRNFQQITPDFIVDTQDDGTVTFTLNSGDVPEIAVSQSFADTLQEYKENGEHMSRQMKEALLYTRTKVQAAHNFIEAIKVRYHTLTATMKAIIQIQNSFFVEGDEMLLKPMTLKDVAEKTGLDISTISRVNNSKYVQTRWGIFPLKHFFSDGFKTEDGDELASTAIKQIIQEIFDSEDKKHPWSDQKVADEMQRRGYPVARRTVTKYRIMMNIPVARMRKK